MSINSCANKHKKDINELNNKSLKIIDKLHASKTIGKTSINKIKRLVERMKQEIRSQYETYEETLMEHSDDQKEQFRQWINIFAQGIAPEQNLIKELANEREQLKKETKMMRAEQRLWEQSHEKIENILTTGNFT
jgi:hypothetical protein